MNDDRPILTRKFDEFAANRSLVEVYRDQLADAPLVGRIIQHSRSVFLMEKVNDTYEHDGVVSAFVAGVTRVKCGGRELEVGASVARMSEHPLELPNPDVSLLQLSTVMTFLERSFGHVSLYAERIAPGCCFIGQVIELDDDFILMCQFGTRKSMDRAERLIRTDEVTRVEAGGKYERQLMDCFSREHDGA